MVGKLPVQFHTYCQPLTCITGESLYIHGVQLCMLTTGTFETLKDTANLKCAKYDNSRLTNLWVQIFEIRLFGAL